MMRQTISVVLMTCVLTMLVGCASHTVVPSAGPRKPTSPQDVRVYQKHPKQYEQLGKVIVNVTPEMKWDERGDSTAGFEALKAQAAALGANGVLLTIPAADYEYLVTVGYQGTFYQLPMRREPRTIVAEAVFVLEQ